MTEVADPRTSAPGTHATNAEAVIAHFTPLYGLTTPGTNVLTFRKWQDQGRCVKKGEHGFGIFVYSGRSPKDPEPGEPKDERKRGGRWVKVFHEAQTEICDENSAREDPDPGLPPGEPVKTQPAPRPAPARPLRGMTDKQIAEVEQAIMRADRASGGLARSTSTGKRWREALGGMRDRLRTIKDRPDLTARLQHAIAVVESFERVTPGQTGLDYFPTGPVLASRMWGIAKQHHAGRDPRTLDVLEPSAGDGALIAGPLADAANVFAIERSSTLRECLQLQFRDSGCFTLGESTDYLEDDSVPEGLEFDVVLMNPPFAGGASAAHLQLAYRRDLAPGGIIAAVVGEGVFTGGDRRYAPEFPAWLDSVDATVEVLPEGSFEGTSSRARLVIITK